MSKIKLALIVVENLKQLAANLESLAQAMEAKDEMSEKTENPITIEQVRAVLAEKSQSGKQPEVKALINKYGANKLTDIDPACYKELLKEAEVL